MAKEYLFKKGHKPWNTGRALGLYQSKFYRSWSNMKTRCYDPNFIEFHRYGGRGITVCDKWLTFKGFYEDMYSSYQDNLSLDRIDNDGNYCKENCKWSTKKEQARNTSRTKKALRYCFENKLLTTSEWAILKGIKRTTLDMRLREYRWSIEKALGGGSCSK